MKVNHWLRYSWLVCAVLFWYFMNRMLTKFLTNYLSQTFINLPSAMHTLIVTVLIPYGFSMIILCLLIKPLVPYRFLAKKKMTFKELVNYSVVMNGIGMFIFLLFILGCRLIGVSIKQPLGDSMVSEWLMALLLLLLNPIFEGILFRKLLLERVPALPHLKQALLGGLLFAVPHFFSLGIVGGLRTFWLGIFLAYVTLDSGSLKYSAILHSISNLYAYYLLTFLLDYPVLFFLFYFVGMPCWAFYLIQRYFKSAPSSEKDWECKL
ncbi:CPBP family intramembrane glutamic endopeptidase [Facklamia lactis]|uniref:CPBP family intramembrane glutamic endopeptidase n=1 Tax=Facklamia lactis TaxID=2749967 RepID=UPI0018CE7B18|nr:CPBP family intramembrane glutamic endopeptidase [Facklamia lactis]MBG9980719.1 CPBP family intramembrane metalloprotease [Facklamia lactis]